MLFGTHSAGADWILAGLGNPGEKYARTRHNMGFLTLDCLAEKRGIKINKIKFQSAYNILRWGESKVLLMKPQTYMNLSGEAVAQAARFYKIPPEHIIIVYDDVSLPVGKLRVRPNGSAGGHNGMKSIIAHLGTQDFPRIKIGIGSPTGEKEERDMVDWVIGVPSQGDRKILLDVFAQAMDAAECIIENDGCQQAMNRFN
jgi:PTH1 family peptidyl-tRNA hydrolase